jgi:hypothetical protein
MLRPNPLNHLQLTMEKNFRWCPTFRNLINLTLDCSCLRENFYALIVFLQNSPSLKKLTLKLDQVWDLYRVLDLKVNFDACTIMIKHVFFLLGVCICNHWRSGRQINYM